MIHLLIYLFSFVVIWLGAGLIVTSTERFAKKLKLSSFTISFFVLGMLTSIPEFAVGMTAITTHDPEIFVGNLLGGIPVLFLLVIPLLAIFGNGINLSHKITASDLATMLLVIAAPSVFMIDQRITQLEGLSLLFLYAVLFYVIERNKGVLDIVHSEVMHLKFYSASNIVKIVFGIVLVFVASHFIVEETLNFSRVLGISPLYLSLVALSIGTNAPELSLAVRSVLNGKKDVALGDYLGSAAANTFLFGLFTLIYQKEIHTEGSFLLTFLTIVLGLSLFYIFARSKNTISRLEGVFLLITYLLFAITQAF